MTKHKFIILVLILTSLVFLSIAPIIGHESDMKDLRNWTAIAVNNGISQIYNGDSTKDFALYPPGNIYLFKVVGHVYLLFSNDLSFENPIFFSLLKLLLLVLHLLTVLLIYIVYKGKYKKLVVLLYALNPALLINLAYLGESDALHTFLILLSIVLFFSKYRMLSAVTFSLAVFTKPQVWVLIPFFFFLWLFNWGIKRTLIAGGLGLLTASVVTLPFILAGTLPLLGKSFASALGVLPYLSNRAFNTWALFSQGSLSYVKDSGLVIGSLSYWGTGMFIFASIYTFILFLLRYNFRKLIPVLTLLAILMFAYFMFPTRVHRNHIYFVFPVLALLFDKVYARNTFFILTATFLLNLGFYAEELQGLRTVVPIQMAGSLTALVNLATFIYFVKNAVNDLAYKNIIEEIIKIKNIVLGISVVFLIVGVLVSTFRDAIFQFVTSDILVFWTGFQKSSDSSFYIDLISAMINQIYTVSFMVSVVGFICYFYIRFRKKSQ